MDFCAISDSHNKHESIIVPPCDVLLHAGDFSGMGQIHEIKAFLEWFNKQPAKHKIFISGNHDFLDESMPAMFKSIVEEYPGVTYLRDEMVEIEGIKIYGRPWVPRYYDWAFMCDKGSPKMLSTLSIVPKCDILLTHGPAYGINDEVNGEHVGCEDLLNELERIQPQVLVAGHLHSAHGDKIVNGIRHINAAVLNDRYKLTFTPVQFSLDKRQ